MSCACVEMAAAINPNATKKKTGRPNNDPKVCRLSLIRAAALNPKGIPSSSPGLRVCELPWVTGPDLINPERVAAQGPDDATPLVISAKREDGSADFQVCCIASFQTCDLAALRPAADLEIGDTAGLETCATELLQ